MIVIAVILAFPHCKKESDSGRCNVPVTIRKEYKPSDLEMHNVYSLDNDMAKFSVVYPTIENVQCMNNHVSVKIWVEFKNNFEGEIDFYGEIVYGIFFLEYMTEWTKESENEGVFTYTSQAEAGLADSFGEGPGWFFPLVDIRMTDQGSADTNIAMFNNSINKVEFLIVYFSPVPVK